MSVVASPDDSRLALRCNRSTSSSHFSWPLFPCLRPHDTEKSYPYEAVNDKCRYNPAKSGATVSGYVNIKRGSEDDLKAAVATVGPISVSIDANHTSFQFHNKHEIYDDPDCSSESGQLDHGVLVIGYGTTKDGRDYWLVKNSWGTDWGNEGYFKMARNKNNACGVATDAVYPLV